MSAPARSDDIDRLPKPVRQLPARAGSYLQRGDVVLLKGKAIPKRR